VATSEAGFGQKKQAIEELKKANAEGNDER
jgi:hypothetical protein